MRLFLHNDDPGREMNQRLTADRDETPEYVFDDEPLEGILYGGDFPGPTRANLYLPAIELSTEILRASSSRETSVVLGKSTTLGKSRIPLSRGVCATLAIAMRRVVPDCPRPVIEVDLSPLGPLLEKMWGVANDFDDPKLKKAIGSPVYRWYEHHERYGEARRVLLALIEIHRGEGARLQEARMVNNFAFEYLLECRWWEAIPSFEEAATIFKEEGDSLEYANARTNYWACRLEADDFRDMAKARRELEAYVQDLDRYSAWHARKPLILLARIEERRGNLRSAIRLVEGAIKKSANSQTRYPELDREYLQSLKSKRKTRTSCSTVEKARNKSPFQILGRRPSR